MLTMLWNDALAVLQMPSLHQIAYTYGVQIIVVVTLIAITIFRKEMSCNHCYSSEQELQSRTARYVSATQSSSSSTSSIPDDVTTTTTTGSSISSYNSWMTDVTQTESLLDEASCYGSGTYTLFLNTIRFLLRHAVYTTTMISHTSTTDATYRTANTSSVSSIMIPYFILWDAITVWWTVAAKEGHLEDILDGAGNWSVLGPHQQQHTNQVNNKTNAPFEIATTTIPSDYSIFPTASQNLPTDVMVHLFSYLYPKDIVALAGTNRDIYDAILAPLPYNENSNTTTATTSSIGTNDLSRRLWKTLWQRDYGWILEIWDVGHDALQRSFRSLSEDTNSSNSSNNNININMRISSLDDIIYTSTFYFRFGMSYVNYIIAGHCHRDQCLIGLGGHIYDLTNFIDVHPGSSETLLANSGRDVSSIFETMRHTISARNMAEQLCVVVDSSLLPDNNSNGVGAHPTIHLQRARSRQTSFEHLSTKPSPVVSHRCHTNRSAPSTMEHVYYNFIDEQEIYQRRSKGVVSKLRLTGGIVGDVHVYFDPIIDRWRGWYMNTNFESVFINL